MMSDSILKATPLGFPWETPDPFLTCVHHKDLYPAGNAHMGPDASLEGRNLGQDFTLKDGWRMYHGHTVPGFPAHPHRGFETVTIVLQGFVDHCDSLGSSGRYGNGDVQWLTTGKGVQHSEMFPLRNKNEPNPLELFQIWLNLGAAHKMVEPHFKMLWNDMVPRYIIKDAAGKSTEILVVAGEIKGNKAPSPPPDSYASDPQSNIAIWNITMEAGARWTLPGTEPGINRSLYFYEGATLSIAQENIDVNHSLDLRSDHEVFLENGTEKSRLLLLQGKPLNEPVFQYGPFVMNTRDQVRQAMEDYQATEFGGWPWPKPDHVHDRYLGRFSAKVT